LIFLCFSYTALNSESGEDIYECPVRINLAVFFIQCSPHESENHSYIFPVVIMIQVMKHPIHSPWDVKFFIGYSWRYSKIQGVVLPNTVDQIISWCLHSQTRKTVFMSNHYTM